MLSTLGFMGFGALAMQEGRSFMNGHLGERISGENITIWDDGRDERGIPMPFDFEGVPKQRVTLIEEGIARGVVYDSFTAGREEGKVSTGHSLPAPNTAGPMPLSLFMAPGQATKEQMLASTERGIWVTTIPLYESCASGEDSPHRHDPRRDVPDRERRAHPPAQEHALHREHPGSVRPGRDAQL